MTQQTGPGYVVGGRYRLDKRLRSGGFGHVWKAHDLQLEVDVAVKEVQLPAGTPDDEREERLARAAREARNAAKLRDHPNIVSVHDVVLTGAAPWIVMRLVDGISLADRLGTQGALPVEEAAKVADGLLKALAAAHEAHILHRDVKPDNVMLAPGEVLLTDFGTAIHPANAPVTMPGMLIGTREYTAPERLKGEGDRPASDLFSLGATLYHAVEGVSPFHRDGDSIASLTAVLYEEAAEPVRAGALAGLIMLLLEKDPEDRPTVRQAQALLARSGAADAPKKKEKKPEKTKPKATKVDPLVAKPKTPRKSVPKAVPKPVSRPVPPPVSRPVSPPVPRPVPRPAPKPTTGAGSTNTSTQNGWRPWMWWIVLAVGLVVLGFILWGRDARDAVAGDCVYYEEDDGDWYHEPCGMHWPSTGNYEVVMRYDGYDFDCLVGDTEAYWPATEEDPPVTLCLRSVD